MIVNHGIQIDRGRLRLLRGNRTKCRRSAEGSRRWRGRSVRSFETAEGGLYISQHSRTKDRAPSSPHLTVARHESGLHRTIQPLEPVFNHPILLNHCCDPRRPPHPVEDGSSGRDLKAEPTISYRPVSRPPRCPAKNRISVSISLRSAPDLLLYTLLASSRYPVK